MALTNLTKVQTVGIGSNIEVVGVVTTGQFKSGTSNLHSTGVELTNLNVSGIATIGGNLSIGGTLTYEDVTNIDSIGIVTARAGVNVSGGQLDVGSNIKLGNAGVITATTFKGNGDFVELDVDGHTNLDNVSIVGVTTFNGLSSNDVIRVRSADSNGNSVVNILSEGTTGNSRILFSDTAATSGDGWISYSHNDRALTFTTAGTSNERLRIDSSGNVNIGAKDYNTHSASIDSLQIGHALNLYEDSYSSGTDNYVILANNLYYNSGNKYMRNDEASRIMMQGGAFYFQNAVAGTAGNAITLVDVLRITSGGYVGINETSPDNALHIKSTTDTQQIKLENTVSTGRAQIRYVNPQADWQQGIIGGTTEGDFITYTSAAKNIRFYTNNSEKVRITSTGQLLLGETSAFDSNVAIQFRKDNAGSQSRFIFRNRGNNGSSRVRLVMSTLNRAANGDIFSGMEQYQSGGMAIFNGQSDTSYCNIGFFAGNWQPITLKNGNVSGGDAIHCRAYWGTSNGIQMEVGGPQSGTHKSIRFYTSHYGGERGYIGVTLGGTSYNSSSDYRMKQDVVDMTGAIDRIKLFLPKRFKWKEDPTYTVDGFLAHEASTVVPESVVGEKDAVDSNGDPEYQVMDNSKLVPVLTAALKEAIAKIEILETKVAALEGS